MSNLLSEFGCAIYYSLLALVGWLILAALILGGRRLWRLSRNCRREFMGME